MAPLANPQGLLVKFHAALLESQYVNENGPTAVALEQAPSS
jgi:hypothetical protein